jgi:hypothetical protein
MDVSVGLPAAIPDVDGPTVGQVDLLADALRM